MVWLLLSDSEADRRQQPPEPAFDGMSRTAAHAALVVAGLAMPEPAQMPRRHDRSRETPAELWRIGVDWYSPGMPLSAEEIRALIQDLDRVIDQARVLREDLDRRLDQHLAETRVIAADIPERRRTPRK